MDKKVHAAIKFAIMIFFLMLAVTFVYLKPPDVTISDVRLAVESFGMWRFIIFVTTFALSSVFLVPGSILTLIGALLFGVWIGTLLNLIGAVLGGALSFLVARKLGRDFVEHMMHEKLNPTKKILEKNGFQVMLIIRLIPAFPFFIVNYAAGLTSMTFFDFIVGTSIGMILPIFVLTNLFSTIGESALSDGISIQNLITIRVAFAIVMFLILLVIALIAKKRLSHLRKA